MTSSNRPFHIKDFQNDSLESLIAKLQRRVGALAAGEVWQVPGTHKPHFSNVFGLLGSRGAGKSTLLGELYHRWYEDTVPGLRQLYMLPMIECPTLPREIAPGTAVFLRLLLSLEASRPVESENPFGAPTISHEDALTRLVKRYPRIDNHDLSLELSSSADDYSQNVIQGLSDRFTLGVDLSRWLEESIGQLKRPDGQGGFKEADLKAVVVLLDDFDLARNNARLWQWIDSLLEELHQHRLFFVLTADPLRLENLDWARDHHIYDGAESSPVLGDGGTENPKSPNPDRVTSRAMIEKLLPRQNQVVLESWNPASGAKFRPTSEDKTPSLWEMLTKITRGERTLEPLIACLRPSEPRGLRNLYMSVRRLRPLDARGLPKNVPRRWLSDGATLNPKWKELIRSLLIALADCRKEAAIARRLRTQELEDWLDTRRFSDTDLSVEDWQRAVERATQRPTGKDLQYLALVQELLDSNEPLHRDRAYWVELLLDLGLEDEPSSRIRLVTNWRPLVERLDEAVLALPFGREELREFFYDNQSLIDLPLLSWMAGRADDLTLGWVPLFRALRGDRDALLPDLFRELRINPGQVQDSPPAETNSEHPDVPAGADTVRALLPHKLWALILWTDALHRCPWRAFSIPLGWSIVTCLGLSAAFVRSAYTYALATGRCINDPQKPVTITTANGTEETICAIGILAHRDPRPLLRLQEDTALRFVAELFTQDEDLIHRLQKKRDPLSASAIAFLKSPQYGSVVRLVQEHQAWQSQLG